MMISTPESTPLDQWRERFGGRRRRAQARTIAALGYLTDCPAIDGLVPIEKLTLVLLYDEPIRLGQCALRLVGYRAAPVAWGVRFGGRNACRFVKDLMLQPVPGGDGYRIDLADEELLALGLLLERDMDRCVRFHKPVRECPNLPKLWAAFSPESASGVTGDGPELHAYAARVGADPAELFERFRRQHHGMTLLPLPWASHRWQDARAIFADLHRYPKRQVFRLHGRDDLAGFQAAAEFDFLDRSGVRSFGRRPRRAALAAA